MTNEMCECTTSWWDFSFRFSFIILSFMNVGLEGTAGVGWIFEKRKIGNTKDLSVLDVY